MNADIAVVRRNVGSSALDRWFYVFMAALSVATAVAGFSWTSSPALALTIVLVVHREYGAAAAAGFADNVSNGLLFKAKSVVLFVIFLAGGVLVRRAPHWSYLVGVALFLPWAILPHALWDSAWWLSLAPKLMGAG